MPNMLFGCLLACIISGKKAAVVLIFPPLSVIILFSCLEDFVCIFSSQQTDYGVSRYVGLKKLILPAWSLLGFLSL